MRLSIAEVESLADKAFGLTMKESESLKAGYYDCDDFKDRQMEIFADLVADAVTEKMRSNIQWALDRDE